MGHSVGHCIAAQAEGHHARQLDLHGINVAGLLDDGLQLNGAAGVAGGQQQQPACIPLLTQVTPSAAAGTTRPMQGVQPSLQPPLTATPSAKASTLDSTTRSPRTRDCGEELLTTAG